MIKRLPIRWRLTLLYGLSLTAGLLLFGVILYTGMRYLLYEDFEERVRAQTALISAAIQFPSGEPVIDSGAVESWQDDDNFLRFYSTKGELDFDSSAIFGDLDIDQEHVSAALQGRTTYSTDESGSEPLGIVTAPLTNAGQNVGAMQIGMSRSDVDEVLRLLLISLAIAGPVVIGAAAAGGYLLAGRALKPVDSITSLAAHLSADDLNARLDLELPDDELGRLATTFNAMLDRIQSAFDRQRRFTGDAAHELRTPLSTINSEIELTLSQPRSPEEYQAALAGVQTGAERMSNIVRALLMLARADAGSLPVEKESFALDATLHVVLDQYRAPAEIGGIRLRDEIAPATLVADEDLIVQLLVNILDNAISQTPSGGEIELGNRLESATIAFWVTNTGPAIPEADLPHLFEPFYRVDTGRARKTGGIGLGLAICKAIVEAHSGLITISSQPDSVTRVDITLPAG